MKGSATSAKKPEDGSEKGHEVDTRVHTVELN
jgi:hypothetical protein